MAEQDDILLEVRDLRVYFDAEEGEVRAVDGASFAVRRGQTLAVAGESGCGKSVTAYSILRLISKPGRIAGGQILLHPRSGRTIDITALKEKDDVLFRVRGGLVSMIFQEPTAALSPVHTIGGQIREAILLHHDLTRKQAEKQAVTMLRQVGIPAPKERLRQYPFEMSGGMRQRALIAMALACNPELLIADEPTTALDVTLQAQILALIQTLQKERRTSVLLITHDLGVVAQVADDAAVMYLGRIVEQGAIRPLMKEPGHPYTRGLLQSLPSLSHKGKRLASIAGSVPLPTEHLPGCPFHPRCPYMISGRCDVGGPPPLRAIGESERRVACFRAQEI